MFKKLRLSDPHRLENMDLYSTCLWHLRNQVSLSSLAQSLVKSHPYACQSWLTLGNAHSLLKEHESSLKCFERAIEVNPGYAYAHSRMFYCRF